MTTELAVNALCNSAEATISYGVEFARADDPHRFATLPSAFDGGKARRRLVLDYLDGGQVRIALQFLGMQAGEERVAEVFAFTVQGPTQGAH